MNKAQDIAAPKRGGKRNPLIALPRYCESARAFSEFYRIPMDMLLYFRSQGSPAFDRMRVHCIPLFEHAKPTLARLFADEGALVKQILDNAPPDLASLKNSLAVQELEEKKRLNAEARKLIHTKTEVLEMVEEPLQPIFNDLKNFERDFGQEAKTIAAGVDEQIIKALVAAAAKRVNKSILEFRERQGLDND